MTLREYLRLMNNLIEENHSVLDLEVIYSSDDEATIDYICVD